MQSYIRKVYACLAVTCHLHFWQNDWGLLRATAVTQGWNRYRNKSQHRKLTLEKKILLPLQQGFKPATFRSRVQHSNHWAIPAPGYSQVTLMLGSTDASPETTQHWTSLAKWHQGLQNVEAGRYTEEEEEKRGLETPSLSGTLLVSPTQHDSGMDLATRMMEEREVTLIINTGGAVPT